MDYFAKFKRGGVGGTPTSRAKPTAVMQLAKFHKCWNYVHNLYFIEDKKALVNVQQTPIPQHLRSMVDILVDEEIRLDEDQTGLCMEMLLKSNVLTILVNIADSDFPQGVRGEVVRCIASMINLLDDKFLVHNAVFKPTLKLIRMCAEDGRTDENHHEDLMELMYVICSKIHGYPDLLNIFFHDRTWLRTPWRKTLTAEQWMEVMKSNASINSPTGTTRRRLFSTARISAHATSDPLADASMSKDAAVAAAYIASGVGSPSNKRLSLMSLASDLQPDTPVTPKPDYEFMLFTYLLRYVHREGKSGDYARTAILFIIELATGALGDYLLQSSSFPAVTAAGLGALFSQLPRVFTRDEAGNDAEPADFHRQLDAFVKELEFCQDVLDRCPTPAISQALLANIRRVFLENILWPSLALCSDADGSAEAAIGYLDVILRNLRQPAMIDLVLSYLSLPLDTGDDDDDVVVSSTKSRAAKLAPSDAGQQISSGSGLTDGLGVASDGDKKSSDAMEEDTDDEDSNPADGFNLIRLVLKLLVSASEQTVTATLQLLETLLTLHCARTRRLVGGARVKHIVPHRIEDHRRELDLYMSVAGMLNPDLARDDDAFAEGYDRYLLDAEAVVETHRIAHEITGACPPRYRVDPEAPLPRALNRLLGTYYTNPRRLNLALSGVMAALAHCQYRDVDGWMACVGLPANKRGRGHARRNQRRTQQQRQRRRRHRARNNAAPGTDPTAALESTGLSSDDDFLLSDDDAASGSTAYDDDDTEETTEEGTTDTDTLASRDGPGVSPPPVLYCTLELLSGKVLELRARHPEFDTYLRERRKGIRQPHLSVIPRRTDDASGRQISDLVDSTVMLEEVCKEWLSLVQVRRGVGLDAVAFY